MCANLNDIADGTPVATATITTKYASVPTREKILDPNTWIAVSAVASVGLVGVAVVTLRANSKLALASLKEVHEDRRLNWAPYLVGKQTPFDPMLDPNSS